MSYRLKQTFEAFEVKPLLDRGDEPEWFKAMLATGAASEEDDGYTFDIPHPMGPRWHGSAKVGDWIMQKPHGIDVIDAERFAATFELAD